MHGKSIFASPLEPVDPTDSGTFFRMYTVKTIEKMVQLNITWVFLAAIVLLLLMPSQFNLVEGFRNIFPNITLTLDDYATDVRTIAEGIVGPFIGDLYLYLRNKNFNPGTGAAIAPMYVPTTVGDEMLSDPVLVEARAQVIQWIEALRDKLSKKYDQKLRDAFAPQWDLTYRVEAGRLIVRYTSRGSAADYIL